jgi:hypothetical protein
MPGNVTTENGYPECEWSECERSLVPGTDDYPVHLGVRKGDAATILTAWAAWYHRNVRPINTYRLPPERQDWWGWSEVNKVWNSNHLSGTAIDICSTQFPFGEYRMSQNDIATVELGLQVFEGHVYWGGHWNYPDQMHFQMNGGTFNNPRTTDFADRLRGGYLNLYGPPDPLAYPLPAGYYYGPLDGPPECISGEYETDSEYAKDGLGRWQAALGLPVTRKWNDGKTPKAATTLQLERGWPPNLLFGHGGIYWAEWNVVMREGWRLPAGWDAVNVPAPESPITKWGDYSHYQSSFIDDSYPYQAVCFRASIADEIDDKFQRNLEIARRMVNDGKLKKIIAYHFWVPGRANWETFQRQLDAAGGVFPELAFMLDVESGGDKWNIRGDQTIGVKDFIRRGQGYFGNPQAASIYTNFTATPDLLLGINEPELFGVKLIVPRYQGMDSPPDTPAGVRWFGHQYSSKEDTPPFGPSDINYSRIPLPGWLEAWGVNNSASGPSLAVTTSFALSSHAPQCAEAVPDLSRIWLALERIATASDVDLADLARPTNDFDSAVDLLVASPEPRGLSAAATALAPAKAAKAAKAAAKAPTATAAKRAGNQTNGRGRSRSTKKPKPNDE